MNMEKRQFKNTNEKVSLLGFGCMRFPTQDDGKINRKEAFKMLDYAYDKGVNYYDTAYPYHGGESEIVVGEWLATKDRSSLYLATKSPVWSINSIEEFNAKLNEQLAKLQTEYIDYYLLHALDQTKWTQLNAYHLLDHLSEVVKSGKVKKIGFSFHDEYPLFEEIIHSYPWDFCQIQYNYMDTEYQAGLKGYDLASEKGIPVVIMEPIKGGQLAKVPNDIRILFDEVAPNYSDSAMALRFLGSHPNVLTILSGMSLMEHIEDNTNTMNHFECFTEAEYAVIEKAREVFLSRVQVLCTKCAYCMPCPLGVDIPGNFTVLNNAYIYDNFAIAKQHYSFMSGSTADKCVNCKVCISKCPQHIDIPEKLLQVRKEIAGE